MSPETKKCPFSDCKARIGLVKKACETHQKAYVSCLAYERAEQSVKCAASGDRVSASQANFSETVKIAVLDHVSGRARAVRLTEQAAATFAAMVSHMVDPEVMRKANEEFLLSEAGRDLLMRNHARAVVIPQKEPSNPDAWLHPMPKES